MMIMLIIIKAAQTNRKYNQKKHRNKRPIHRVCIVIIVDLTVKKMPRFAKQKIVIVTLYKMYWVANYTR